MEKSFESTLQKERNKILERAQEHVNTAQHLEYAKETEVIINTPAFFHTCGRAKHIAEVIQPSIMEDDLKVAVTLQLAMACELVHNLIKDGVLALNK